MHNIENTTQKDDIIIEYDILINISFIKVSAEDKSFDFCGFMFLSSMEIE
jgi:hypothetical protein